MKSMKYILAGAVLFALSLNAFATDYYVATNGNDANAGNQANPWRTLTKACASVGANQNHTIRLAAGTFSEADIVTIPSGVNVVGAGSGSTIVKVNKSFDPGAINPHSQTYSEQFVIQMRGSNQTVSGFALDGQNTCWGGIFARYMTKTVFDDLFIYNFRYCGLWVPESYGVEIKNCQFKDNAYASTQHGDSGNLMYHDGDGLSVHDCLITEEGALGTMGGYGKIGRAHV